MRKNPQLNVVQQSPIDVQFTPFNQIGNGLVSPTEYLINPPATYCYWYWMLNLQGGLDVTMIDRLEVYANTTMIYQISGSNLDSLNQWLRMNASTAVGGSNILIVPFKRFGLLSGAQDISFKDTQFVSGTAKDNALESALNCGSPDASGNIINNLTLKLFFNNTPANGSLQVTAKGIGTIPWAGGPGMVPFLETTTFSAQAARNNMTPLNPFKVGDIQHTYVDQLAFIPQGGGTLDNFQLWYQQTLWWQRNASELAFLQTTSNLRTSQAGINFIDFSADGYGDESIYTAPKATDLRLYVDDNAQEAITVLQKSYGYLF
jgi:hypothetical protein